MNIFVPFYGYSREDDLLNNFRSDEINFAIRLYKFRFKIGEDGAEFFRGCDGAKIFCLGED